MRTKRFHNPEYKKQIQAVRTYRRQVQREPESRRGKFFYALGLESTFSKIVVLVALALLVYLTYFAKFLRISDFEINGVDAAARAQVLQNLQNYTDTFKYLLPQKNIVFFSSESFSKYLLAQNYQIAKVNSIDKRLWHTLVLDLEQRVPAFTLQIGARSYILNSDGTVGAELAVQQPDSEERLAESPEPQYPLILDTANEEVNPGERFFSEQQNNFLRFIAGNFEKQISVAVQSYEIPGKASDQLIVHTAKGFKVFFSNLTDANLYLQRLKALWLQFTPDQQSRLAYLDLRFEKNAYGCFKGDPCAQQ